MYISENILGRLTHTSGMRNNALHGLTLIKMISARLVGTGGFLIRYSNGHTKLTHGQLTFTLLKWRIWWAPKNASKWQTAFNSAFKGLRRQYLFMRNGQKVHIKICRLVILQSATYFGHLHKVNPSAWMVLPYAAYEHTVQHKYMYQHFIF